MAKKKVEEVKVEETLPEVTEPEVEVASVEEPQAPEPTPEVAVVESEAKKQFRALIEQYRRTTRPEKFARKEPELLEKLSKL